jgi:HSP20 family molecular chaperone IbpA
VDYDAINAKFDSGVLDLALPKIQPQKPKEREVAIN